MKSHKSLHTIEKKTNIAEEITQDVRSGELLVEPLFVGVCGTDLQIIRRQRPDPAVILGHEGIARVIDSKDIQEAIQAGDLLVFNPVDPSDQNQILGHNTPGLLQERYTVTQHAIKNNLVVSFPSNTDPLLGALVEPLGTVVYGHDLVSKAVDQQTIAIVGAGAIGIMHALYAKAQGYKKIFLINSSQPHLDWCIERAIVPKEQTFIDSVSLPAKILAKTNNMGVDAVYMCTSRPNALLALERALLYVKNSGCIDLVGGIKDGDKIEGLPNIKDLNAIRRANFCGIPANGYVEKTTDRHGKDIYLTGHRGTSPQHFTTAIENLRQHSDVFNKVVSHIVSFESAAELFDLIAKGPVKEFNGTEYVKAVVDMKLNGSVIKNV